ncbi:MAG: alpha/beta fold hydrolase [Bacteroidales bacterium]|nr:alpha/beta fold hydrolase [Bacteroidales bacterium]
MRFICFYRHLFLAAAALFCTLAASAQLPGRQWQAPADPSYEMREISCVSDGNRLYGEAFIPRSPGKHPAVIMSHGYGASHTGFYAMVDTLAKLGYVCYCYDFAGGSRSGRSEGRTEDMSIFTERQNLLDVIDMVRSWDCVDDESLFLLGESQGGCVSAITAPYVADKIKSIVLVYPALCIPDDAFALYPKREDIPDTVTFMGMRIGRAYYDPLYDGFDIYKEISGYQGDVLIIHGTEDGLVKPEYSAKASNVYEHSEFHLIFGAGHGFRKPEHRAQYHSYVIDFLTRQMRPRRIQAYLASLRSDPSTHTLRPDSKKAKNSPYLGSKNYGKRIAVFGGSLSVNAESDVAKQLWADMLGAEVVTYGVGGAGFSIDQGYSLQKQVDTAGVYDVYVLWASTNDFTNDRPCGSWSDYTAADGYDETKRHSQCGGINYCIRRLLEKNPQAEIYFFTSLRFFGTDSGHNPFSVTPNKAGKTFAEYVEAQKACCAYYGIPVLDQFNLQGINEFNVKNYYKDDLLHMNEEGYRRIAPVQATFLSNGR